MKMKLSAGLAIGLFLVGTAGMASATIISESVVYSPVLQVDGNSSTATLAIGTGGAIQDLNVWVDFTKCDNPLLSDGSCGGTGYSFNREIHFRLTGPDGGIYADLIEHNINGQTGGARVTYTFDDEASSLYPSTNLTSGTWNALDSLSIFDGLDSAGTWSLYYQDSVGADPLSLNAWGLNIVTASVSEAPSASVPEPATMFLFGTGIAGLAGIRRRRKKN